MPVSEVCAQYHVTRKTLFYYDRHDILKPSVRIGEQAHKYYSAKDLRNLERILKYKEAGLQLEEIRQLIYDPACDRIAVMKQAEERITAEINRKKAFLNRLQELKADKE